MNDAAVRTAALGRPRAIVFDWDNTLIDNWPAIQDAQNHVFAHFGMPPWTLEDPPASPRLHARHLSGHVRRPLAGGGRGLLRPLYYGSPSRDADAAARCRGHAGDPGAAADFVLAVVSNKKGDYLRREAAHIGWDRFFHRIVGAFDARLDKPAPEPVDMALEDCGVETGADVWFAGDADIDLECARDAGCVGVLVRAEPPAEGEFSGIEPAVHVDGCLALCKLWC